MKKFFKSFLSTIGTLLAWVLTVLGLYWLFKKSDKPTELQNKTDKVQEQNEEIIQSNDDYLSDHSADEFKRNSPISN